MPKSRLEAFSDGVIAIIITIMVLSLRVPASADAAALTPVLPPFLCYVLSFVSLGIYWNNHHHLLHTARHVTAGILWANLHLLFWLSLVPFVTAWLGENHFATLPMALYGAVMLCAAVSYYVLQSRILRAEGPHSVLARAIGADWKGKASLVVYAVAVAVAFAARWVAGALYVTVALLWLVPDRRIEAALARPEP